MTAIVIGIFMILHGLVHLLYFGQSARRFELQPGLVWPDGSWTFSRWLGDETARSLACIACAVAALGFTVSGISVLANQNWWRLGVAASSAFSAALILLFWDGKMQMLDGKGGIGLLINLVILAALFVLR